MKLDKYRVKKAKMGFIGLCFVFLIGLLLVVRIADLFIKTVEIDATVTHTYETRSNVKIHKPGGPKMNIEWMDLNGEIQKEGGIANKGDLSEGDIYTISVDAKTQSRRIPSKIGSVVLFAIGIVSCVMSIKLMRFFYGVDTYCGG